MITTVNADAINHDFIDTWIKLVETTTDANTELIELAGLVLLSSLAKNFGIFDITNADFEEDTVPTTKLNLYALVIGEPGLSRKSTVFKKVEKVVLKVLGEQHLSGHKDTPEKLEERLAQEPHRIWIMDEFGVILEASMRKDYMAGLTGLLQKLYDGTTFVVGTKTRGSITIKNPYFSILVATTVYSVDKKYINEDMFAHGLLSRFLILWDEGTRQPVFRSERMKASLKAQLDTEIRNVYNKLLNKAEVIAKKEPTILQFNGEALKRIDEIEMKIYNIIKNTEDAIVKRYLSRFIDHLIKIAGLYRISRITMEDLEKPVLIVEETDVAKAYQFLDKYVLKSFKKLREYMKIKAKVKPREASAIKDNVELVKTIFRKQGEKVTLKVEGKEIEAFKINRTKLTKAFYTATDGLSSEELDKALSQLIDMGELIAVPERVGGRGRPPITYYLKVSENK